MSVNQVNQATGALSPIAGGTLYADEPIGAILPFGGSTVPNGFLLCNGAAVSRITYAALFAVIGTSFGIGDGSTTFNIPDLRESVPVGAGQNATQTIAAHDTYTVGQFKDDQMQNAEGNFTAYSYSDGLAGGAFSSNTDNPNVLMGGTTPTLNFDDFNFNLSKVARTGTTTHGKQMGVNFIIKATNNALPTDFADVFNRKSITIVGDDVHGLYLEKSNKVVCVNLTGIIAASLITGTIPAEYRPVRDVLITGTLINTTTSYSYVCWITLGKTGSISGSYNPVNGLAVPFNSSHIDYAIFGSTAWIVP